MSQLHCTFDIKSVTKSDFDEITEEDLANLSDVSDDWYSTNFIEEIITNGVVNEQLIIHNRQRPNQELLNESSK